MNESTAKKFQEALSDEAFAKEVTALTTPEEAQAKFREKGYEFTLEELAEFGKAMAAAAKASGELSDDDLEAVAGGVTAGAVIETMVYSVITVTGAVATVAGAVSLAAW